MWLDAVARRAPPVSFACNKNGRTPCMPPQLSYPEDAHGLRRTPATLNRPATLVDYDPQKNTATRRTMDICGNGVLEALEVGGDAVDAFFVRAAIEERDAAERAEKEEVEEARALLQSTMAPSEAIALGVMAEKAVLESQQ